MGRIYFKVNYSNSLKKKLSYTHRRSINFIDQKLFLIQDRIAGKRIEIVENLLHLHPHCEIKINADEILVQRNNESVSILWNSRDVTLEVRDWFYVPEFGRMEESRLIIFKPKIEKIINMYYVITPSVLREHARSHLHEWLTI